MEIRKPYEAPVAEVLHFENDYIFAALTNDSSMTSNERGNTSYIPV